VVSRDGKTADILFTAENVPSVGFAVYHVQSSEESGVYDTGLVSGQDENGFNIENSFYRVEINKSTGNVKRIFDKRNNREVLSNGKEIELQKLEDTPNGGWEAWVMDYDDECATPTLINNAPDIKLIESGPVRTTIQVKKSEGSSNYTQNISLYASVDRVDFPMTVDWHETNKTVFASFPLAVSNPNATYDLSYGTVQRGNRTDISRLVPAQKWADLTDNAGEIVLDKIFIEVIKSHYPNLNVEVIVRGKPVYNDATITDANIIRLCSLVPVIQNGTDIPGTQLDMINDESLKTINHADLIISKGQGNFETLGGCGKNIYYIFLCKCGLFTQRFNMEKYTGIFTNEKRIQNQMY
jgi:hypothetical protein